jgi:hypothetical protein
MAQLVSERLSTHYHRLLDIQVVCSKTLAPSIEASMYMLFLQIMIRGRETQNNDEQAFHNNTAIANVKF